MKWMKKNVAQVCLIVVSSVAVIGAVWMIVGGMKFPGKFEAEIALEEVRERQLPESHIDDVAQAGAKLMQQSEWKLNQIGEGREVPIFRSVPVIQKERELFVA